ncbi:HAD family hydrolase [Microlunatus sp. GCM10028923]|uniref:HAD family hydrolase n=1 Tax=Microlunatus sp. GCM10028923 TaxID=3273400 RepID=UPI0036174779
MLLLMDLDNTLVDREAAFAAWASRFVAEVGGGPGDVDWLLELDADGYTPRDRVAVALRDRFELTDSPDLLVARLLREHVEEIRAVDGVAGLLESLASQGVRRVIVSNGSVWQQRRKLKLTGLADLVDDVIISEAVGCKKPDPRIFAIAMDRSPDRSEPWMIGDHPDADVRGAARVGLRTGWVDRGRSWPGDDLPTVQAATAPAVIEAALATGIPYHS